MWFVPEGKQTDSLTAHESAVANCDAVQELQGLAKNEGSEVGSVGLFPCRSIPAMND
jgi:hypothetical protein